MDKLTEEQKRLVEENVNLAYWYARKMYRKEKGSLKYEDYISACLFGLTKAARSFHPDKSKLATYAIKCMQNEIFMMYRKEGKNLAIPYTCVKKPEDKRGVEIDDADYLIGLQIEIRYPYIDYEFIKKGIDHVLNERETTVIIKRYFEDKKQQEIGEELNLQQSYISRVEKKALKKLNQYYKETTTA